MQLKPRLDEHAATFVDVTDEWLQNLVLLALLAAIGWGAGLAAAMVWGAIRGVTPGRGVPVRVAVVAVALMLALTVSYAYALVLANVGVAPCDLGLPLPRAC